MFWGVVVWSFIGFWCSFYFILVAAVGGFLVCVGVCMFLWVFIFFGGGLLREGYLPILFVVVVFSHTPLFSVLCCRR